MRRNWARKKNETLADRADGLELGGNATAHAKCNKREQSAVLVVTEGQSCKGPQVAGLCCGAL